MWSISWTIDISPFPHCQSHLETPESLQFPDAVEEEEERLHSLSNTTSLWSKMGLDTPTDEKGSEFCLITLIFRWSSSVP